MRAAVQPRKKFIPGKWWQAVVRGHIRYYGVPLNQNALWILRFQLGRLWQRTLSRRS